MNSILGKIASSFVRGYQVLISPLTPPSCRFYPVCSEYSRMTFLRHGFVRGIWLTVWRILRCNPFNPGGWDPVPPKRGETEDDESFYVHEHDEIRSELNPGKSNE